MTPCTTLKSQLSPRAYRRSQVDPEKLLNRFPTYPEWESGILKPTIQAIKDFANFMHCRCALLLSMPPKDEISTHDFRSMSSQNTSRFHSGQ